MSSVPIAETLLSPPILFFFLGMAAVWMRSDLRLPDQISKFLSVYLLLAIGFHGGVELSHSGLTAEVARVLLVAGLAAAAIPIWSFFILRRWFDVYNSAAIAATYGSISAVTFVTAMAMLQSAGLSYSGYMVAAMAVMESPAIVVGVLLARHFGRSVSEDDLSSTTSWKGLLKESFASGPVVLLMGSLLIGYLSGAQGWESLKPVLGDPFKGILVLFLLDMGTTAAASIKKLPESSLVLVSFAIVAAVVHAGIGIGLSRALNLQPGDALLLTVLLGSASYIAVPAAARMALPQANAGIYIPMSLGITFPFNVLVGIPLYLAIIRMAW